MALVSALGESSWEELMAPSKPTDLADSYTRSDPLPDKRASANVGEGIFMSKMQTKFISNRGKINIVSKS